MRKYKEEDDLIDRVFSGYGRSMRADYADIFRDTTGRVSRDFLNGLAGWLGVSGQFAEAPQYTKQSTLPLSQALLNFSQLADVLRDSEFDYCLDDEPAAAGPAAVRGREA
jgi:hypothetical protein